MRYLPLRLREQSFGYQLPLRMHIPPWTAQVGNRPRYYRGRCQPRYHPRSDPMSQRFGMWNRRRTLVDVSRNTWSAWTSVRSPFPPSFVPHLNRPPPSCMRCLEMCELADRRRSLHDELRPDGPEWSIRMLRTRNLRMWWGRSCQYNNISRSHPVNWSARTETPELLPIWRSCLLRNLVEQHCWFWQGRKGGSVRGTLRYEDGVHISGVRGGIRESRTCTSCWPCCSCRELRRERDLMIKGCIMYDNDGNLIGSGIKIYYDWNDAGRLSRCWKGSQMKGQLYKSKETTVRYRIQRWKESLPRLQVYSQWPIEST